MNTKQTNIISEYFYRAVEDYIILLEKDYPVKSIIKLIGDHYSLNSAERVLLFRGVAKQSKLLRRQIVRCDTIPSNTLVYLDGFNVVRTIGSYLNGNFIFAGMDGFLRDVSELHRKALKWPILERTLLLIIDFLCRVKPKKITFYFDKPISHSGKMVELTNAEIKKQGLIGECISTYSPDHELKKINSGIICTADSVIIDAALTQVFDMPQAVLQANFSPNIFSISGLMNKMVGQKA